jgi:thioredoxin 1
MNKTNEIEEIRRKKLEGYAKRCCKKGINMKEDSWPNAPVHITDTDMDKVVKKYETIVVDCWAPWCGPCRMVGPIIDELAKEMQGKIVFAKLNVDENQRTSMKYKIMSIPTLLVFKKGNLVDRFVGALPKEMLKQKINSYL